MYGFNLSPMVLKVLGVGSIIAILWSIYYFGHAKPITDLKEDRDQKALVIQKAKDAVNDSKAESSMFEKIWKTEKEDIVKDIKDKTSNIKDSNGTYKSDTKNDINDTIGKHSITL